MSSQSIATRIHGGNQLFPFLASFTIPMTG